jgi:hypothetical protein
LGDDVTPRGMVRLTPHKNSLSWQNVFYGETREECIIKASLLTVEEIARQLGKI